MSATDDKVAVRLETPLPESLPAGAATVVHLRGTCFHRHDWLAGLEVLVDGTAFAADAFAMPRLDLFRALHPQLGAGERPVPEHDPDSADDPEVRAYRSGFWATVPVRAPAEPGARVQLALRLQLETGGSAEHELGQIEVAGPAPGSSQPRAGAPIAICMATCNPDPQLLREQLDSIREQTLSDWTCVVADDCSHPDSYAEIEALLAGDDRFQLSRSERRLGVYRNFERALGLIPADAELVALCDQDDRWYPDKLATLRAGLGEALLVYSDMRLVEPGGKPLAETYWTERSNNHTNLISMLVANTVTGAASLIRREVIERALPFPRAGDDQFHDHWLAMVALATGRIAYVDRPLYDYVQHGGAALGHGAANAGIRPPRPLQRRDPFGVNRLRQRFGPSRPGYFRAYLRLSILARALLERCEAKIPRRHRRSLRRFVAAEHSALGMLWLLLRPLRARIGRDETLGIERMLFRGILWRRRLQSRSRGLLRPAGSLDDASDPEPRMTVQASLHGHEETTHIERMLEPLELAVSEREPERVNVLIPSIDLKHLFGGYIAKFNLARRLAESGRRVRIVTVNRAAPLPADWHSRLEAYEGLGGALAEIEICFAREQRAPLAVNPNDSFVATTWWTAHLAHDALAELRRERFLYLIQEYEPFTFPMGSLAALAISSYELPHVAMFSTEHLQRFFAAHRYGVYGAAGGGAGDAITFENAITATSPPALDLLRQRRSRKLLFYARSEPHARRNMFELGLIALGRAIEAGLIGPEWELVGIGAVEGRSRIELPRGATLEVLARHSQQEYGRMLADHDVGLALMLTPHPSLVPIEMAAAGLLTVTNSFDTKTPDSLEAISANLLVAEPRIDSIVAAIGRAVAAVGEAEARVAGADVAWSRSWEQSLDDQRMAAVNALLERC